VTDPGDITRLLHRWRDGDRDVESQLFELLLPDLRKIAARCMRRERPNHTLQKTALINECFIRLVNLKHIDWRDRGHFLAIVTRKMRHVLIEYARKRGKYKVLQLEGLPEALLAGRNWLEIAVTVDSLLDELEKESPTKCSVVACRSYMGLSTKETAETLGLTEASVEHEWHRARRWLYQKLSEGPCKTVKNG
jgi:RNA polymerase sigma factor (TIGR02999 family)